MRVHDDWTTAGFELAPAAMGTGPFTSRPLLEAWWRHRAAGLLQLVEGPDALIPLHLDDGTVRFLGEADLTDYHSPLGSGAADLLAEYVASLPPRTRLSLDSLPAEAAEVVVKGLALTGSNVAPVQHEVAAVLQLPPSLDEWLANIGKKERHEVRRKGRRFTERAGAPRVERRFGPEAVSLFCAMHRRAGGDKGTFMTDAMEALFADLHTEAGAVIDFLCGDAAEPLAASFGFEDDSAYYLYNSAYEPEAGDLSPGVVLLTGLVQQAIDHGREVLDFLKGDEPYKFRHGAAPRPLYRVDTTVGRSA
jgi:CelD/BcsL family acetyltransferase involved in cellulose biosynthesis